MNSIMDSGRFVVEGAGCEPAVDGTAEIIRASVVFSGRGSFNFEGRANVRGADDQRAENIR